MAEGNQTQTAIGTVFNGFSQCFRQRFKAAAAGEQLVALDCGSGVGRIAEQLLLQHFQEVRCTSTKL